MTQVHKALLVFAGAVVLTAAMFLGASQVGENSADLDVICEKVNAVRVYVDKLVQRTNAVDQPTPKVSDPAIQQLIDDSRRQSEEFKSFAREQSKKATCEI